MRVILKPAGLALILSAFAVLSWLIVYLTQTLRAKEDAGAGVAANAAAAAPAAGVAPPSAPRAVSSDLTNPGFEADYQDAKPYDTKARLSGQTAAPWYDDSSWAPVTVAYSKDTTGPHSGGACQKVVVGEVAAGDAEARVQFVQALKLAQGKKYRAKVWMRSDRPTEIDLALRQTQWPFRYYGVNKVKVGPEWAEAQVTGTVSDPGDTFVMLKVSKPVTFWVDDASLEEAPAP